MQVERNNIKNMKALCHCSHAFADADDLALSGTEVSMDM